MAKKRDTKNKPARRTKMKKGQTMPFADAMALVDDDMPDGAYWALAHEIAGLEYGDGFDELDHGETS